MARSVKMLYEKDASLDALKDKTVAILGFGSQGHAHAQNLRDSGIKVIVAELEGTSNYKLAKELGFTPMSIAQAVPQADLILMTLPDEVQPGVYSRFIAPNLKAGQTLGFTHGFNIHFKTIVPPKNVNVIMVAPKGPGHLVRSEFEKGGGVPCLLAIHQDATKAAKKIGLAWAKGVGGARAGIILTTFKDECETDLFGEQVVLCGGLSSLIKSGFETLTEAGYPAEMAYFECVHEVKLIVDLIYQGGLDYMRYSISNTAEYGDVTRGPRIINAKTKQEMKKILGEIQNGKFAKEFRKEYEGGMKNFRRLVDKDKKHPVEVTGKKLRKMMAWLDAKEPPKN